MYYAVIMAGGTGTRLWPLSRENSPKQALKLVGERTMFQYAVERIAPIYPYERILVVTRGDHAAELMEQAPELPAENYILEPEGRGTAAAIGLAAIHLAHRDPEARMAVLTADHYIADTERFCRVLAAAERPAAEGSMVTLGIQPSAPSTGFGYIKQGAELGEQDGFACYAVERFTEKPDEETARRMVASGEYSWNSGMFIWRAARILEEIERQMPAFFARLKAVRDALGTPDYETVLGREWPRVAKQSIDYGVMEGARQVVVIPVEIGWTDVGSWASLLELLEPDAENNVMIGPHLNIDTQDTFVFGEKRMIATIGVRDLMIIDTVDALLVCAREREQDVKALVERLKGEGRSDLT